MSNLDEYFLHDKIDIGFNTILMTIKPIVFIGFLILSNLQVVYKWISLIIMILIVSLRSLLDESFEVSLLMRLTVILFAFSVTAIFIRNQIDNEAC